MSATVTPFIQGVFAPISAVTPLYVAGINKGTRIEKLTATNQSGVAVPLTLYIVPSGGTLGPEHRVIATESIASLKARDFSEMRHALKSGDAVHALAGTASAISIFMSGTVFS